MEIKYIDTHAHLNLSAFNEDHKAVATRCAEEGVVVVNVGTKESTSKQAIVLAGEYENCYAIIGLHPIQTVPGFHDEEETGEGSKPFQSKGESCNPDFYSSLVSSSKLLVSVNVVSIIGIVLQIPMQPKKA